MVRPTTRAATKIKHIRIDQEENMRTTKILFVIAVPALFVAAGTRTQQKQASDAE